MTRDTITALSLAQYNASESSDKLNTYIALSHPSWAQVIRLVNDAVDTVSNGDTYKAMGPDGLRISLPDQTEEGLPVVKVAIDNVTPDVISEIRKVAGATGVLSVDLYWGMASRPNDIDIYLLDAELRQVGYDKFEIVGTIQGSPIYEMAFSSERMTPSNTPGIF